MNGDGEEIIDEITKGGLPSNVRVEIVREGADFIVDGGIGDEAVMLEAPTVCGQNYTAGARVFPEKCSRAPGHNPVSSTANHYCLGIGWWP